MCFSRVLLVEELFLQQMRQKSGDRDRLQFLDCGGAGNDIYLYIMSHSGLWMFVGYMARADWTIQAAVNHCKFLLLLFYISILKAISELRFMDYESLHTSSVAAGAPF